MLKHAAVALALLSGIEVGIARADQPSPPSATEPVPTAPGIGPYAKGTLGLSFPLTLISNLGAGVAFGEAVPTIDIVKFLKDRAAVDFIVGLNLHKQQVVNNATPPVAEDTTVFGFVLGAGYRVYKHREALHTFVEPTVIFNWVDTSNTNTLAIRLGAVFGVERTIVDWMSLGGAVGAGINFANEFKDIQLATQATLSVNLYWK